MLGHRRRLLVLLPLALAGCAPFVSPGPQRLALPQRSGRSVAICYSAQANPPAQIRALAQATCGGGTTPTLVEQNADLYDCSLTLPVRAVFACTQG